MIGRAIAGLAGLGLIGGVGTVAYNHNGDATVKITDTAGKVQTVQLKGSDGQSYSCPAGTHEKVEQHDIRLGRIKLTLQQVRREERRLEKKYPNHTAPDAVVKRYEALGLRDDRLVNAYNVEVDAHNAVIAEDCKPAD